MDDDKKVYVYRTRDKDHYGVVWDIFHSVTGRYPETITIYSAWKERDFYTLRMKVTKKEELAIRKLIWLLDRPYPLRFNCFE